MNCLALHYSKGIMVKMGRHTIKNRGKIGTHTIFSDEPQAKEHGIRSLMYVSSELGGKGDR
jgi:hypothetical protein